MEKPRQKFCLIFLLPLIAAAGLALFILFGLIVNLPGEVTSTFGSPAPQLGVVEKLVLPIKLYRDRQDLTVPTDPNGIERPFKISLGESPLAVSQRLQEEGLIPNSLAFRNYLVYTGIDTRIQAGDYSLSPTSTPIEIAQSLMDPNPSEATLVILAGWRLEEISASLPTSGLEIAPEEFVAMVQSENLEGYLLPGTYSLPRETRLETLLNNIENAFNAAVSNEMRTGFEQQGLSLQEAVILASIVEREAVVKEEMPLIASVFINRYLAGIKLEADPTVQYALGYNASQDTWWTNPLTAADLEFDSPYNTYKYPNLPPGPICNPSVEALRAVALPAQTPYYYFRSACDGSGRHVFAETFEEHKANACP
jgi:UPF0755 protein